MKTKLKRFVVFLVGVIAVVVVTLIVLQHQEIARLRRMLLLTALGRETAAVGGSGTQAASASAESAIPDLSPEQRVAVITEANKVFTSFVHSDQKERDGDNIPKKFWGDAILNLKPLRVINDRVNIKIVLADDGRVEAGFYVNLPISSFAPSPESFLEFVQISQPTDKSFGTLYRYKLVQGVAQPTKKEARAPVRFAPVAEVTLSTSGLSPRFLNLHAGHMDASATTNFPLVEVRREDSGVLQLGIYNIHAYLVEDRERGRREFENLSAKEFVEANKMAGMFTLPFERFSSFEIQKTNLPMTVLMPYDGYLQVTEVVGGKNPAVKIRYKLLQGAAQSNQTNTTPEKTLLFGPATNGLCAALDLSSTDGAFTLGEPIDVRFHIRNVSNTNIVIAGGSWRQDDAYRITIHDEQGRKIDVHHIWYSGETPIQRNVLYPGESVVFRSSGLEFLAEGGDEKTVANPVGNYVKVKPGRYTVSYQLNFPDVIEGATPPSDWQGELETAPVTVEVLARRTSSVAPGTKPANATTQPPADSDYMKALAVFHAITKDSGGDLDEALEKKDLHSAQRIASRFLNQVQTFNRLVRDPSVAFSKSLVEILVKGANALEAGDLEQAKIIFNTATNQEIINDQMFGHLLALAYEQRLARATNPAALAAYAASGLSFSPVIERVVNDLDKNMTNSFLDLDSGEFSESVFPVGVKSAASGRRALRFVKPVIPFYGIDAQGNAREHALNVFDMVALPIDNRTFDLLTPSALVNAELMLESSRRDQPLVAGKTSATWLFNTREGNLGILQITGFTDNAHGVKIRYKLVEQAE